MLLYTPAVSSQVIAQIVNGLLPVVLLVAGGAALLRFGFFDSVFRKGLDRLVYWVLLPALIIQSLAGAPTDVAGTGGMTLALSAATVAVTVLAYAAAWTGRLARPMQGVVVQAALRGNLAFVGLPVVDLVLGGEMFTRATLLFAPIVVLYNVLGVGALLLAQHRVDASLPRKLLVSLVTNPLLLACVAGLGMWKLGAALPTPVDTTLRLLGRPAAPLALLSLGGAIVSLPLGGRVGWSLVASGLKVAVLPAVSWGLCGLLGLPAEDRLVVMIFSACPTAVASYVLATQLRGDASLAAAAVVVSTVLSGVALAVVLAVAGV